jgi:hypothetical protein
VSAFLLIAAWRNWRIVLHYKSIAFFRTRYAHEVVGWLRAEGCCVWWPADVLGASSCVAWVVGRIVTHKSRVMGGSAEWGLHTSSVCGTCLTCCCTVLVNFVDTQFDAEVKVCKWCAPEYIAQYNQWRCLQFVKVANVMQIYCILWSYVR